MDVNPYAAPLVDVSVEAAPLSNAEQTRRQYLSHESIVRSVGGLYLVASIPFVISSAFALLLGGTWEQRLQMALYNSAFAVPLIGLAIGLLQLRNWARIIAALLTFPSFLLIPLTLALGGMAFWMGLTVAVINGIILGLLFTKKGAKVCSPDYRAILQATPQIKYRLSIFVWFALGLVVLFYGLVFVSLFAAARR